MTQTFDQQQIYGQPGQRRALHLPANFATTSLLLRPAEILADQFVESLIVLGEELSQSGDHHGIHMRMLPALRLSEAAIPVVIAQTVEALGFVEVKVLAIHPMLNA